MQGVTPETREYTTSVRQGTLIGSTAILLWATLAALTALSGAIPPFQLLAMSFALATLIGLGLWLREGGPVVARLRLPAAVWTVGLYGLFGYHFFYFLALRNAPPAEASLVAYLWPLLIVLMSAAGARLRWYQLAGALAGFAGTALLVTGGQGLSLESQYLRGYLFALLCAVIWSSYSVLSRRLGSVPTSSIGAFCAATAVLALGCHLVFEETVWPAGGEWLAILMLGLGPVGAAFYTWDFGVKRGDIGMLGVLAYGAPLLSVALLVALGLAEPTPALVSAGILIVGGAALAGIGRRAG